MHKKVILTGLNLAEISSLSPAFHDIPRTMKFPCIVNLRYIGGDYSLFNNKFDNKKFWHIKFFKHISCYPEYVKYLI